MTAQVVMTCNLYDESSDEALKTQALHNDSQTMDLKEKVCRDTRQTIMISFNDIKRIQQKLAGLDQHLESNEKSREAYRLQFDIGQRKLLVLLNTHNEYFKASRTSVNARYDLAVVEGRTMSSLVRLMKATAVSRTDLLNPEDAGQSRQRDLSGICTVSGELERVVDRGQLMANDGPAPTFRPTPPAVIPPSLAVNPCRTR